MITEEWFSAAELADISARLGGLPGILGRSERRIKSKAVQEGWKCRPRSKRGGGLEYHFSSLPPETQAALLEQRYPSPPPIPSQITAEPDLGSTPVASQPVLPSPSPVEEKDRKLSIRSSEWKPSAILKVLEALEDFCQQRSLGQFDGRVLFAVEYNKGTIQLPDWVRLLIPTVSARNLGSPVPMGISKPYLNKQANNFSRKDSKLLKP